MGNDRGQAEIFDGKADGQNLMRSFRRRFVVTSNPDLTVEFEAIREHSCGLVLRRIGRGLNTGEIAKTVHRSVHNTPAHRANLKRKLGLRACVPPGALARSGSNLSAPAAC